MIYFLFLYGVFGVSDNLLTTIDPKNETEYFSYEETLSNRAPIVIGYGNEYSEIGISDVIVSDNVSTREDDYFYFNDSVNGHTFYVPLKIDHDTKEWVHEHCAYRINGQLEWFDGDTFHIKAQCSDDINFTYIYGSKYGLQSITIQNKKEKTHLHYVLLNREKGFGYHSDVKN